MSRIKDFFRDETNRNRTIFITVNAVILALIYLLFQNIVEVLSVIFHFASGFLSALSPLFLGLIIAYLVAPISGWIERKLAPRLTALRPSKASDPLWVRKKEEQSRLVSVLAAFLLLFLLAAFFLYAFASLITGGLKLLSLREMFSAVYGYFSALHASITDFINEIPDEDIRQTAFSFYQAAVSGISGNFSGIRLHHTILRIGSSAVTFFLGVVVSIYLLKDRDFFSHLWRKLLHLLLPQKAHALFSEFLSDTDRVLSLFLRGAVTDALIVALLSSIALSVYGLPLAVLIGCFAGITNIIPYFGPLIGMIPAFAAGALSHGPGFGAGAVFLLFLVQQADCNFIYPKIVGRTTGLHPLFVLLAVSITGYYGGVLFMILAVPIAGILNQLLHRLLDRF